MYVVASADCRVGRSPSILVRRMDFLTDNDVGLKSWIKRKMNGLLERSKENQYFKCTIYRWPLNVLKCISYYGDNMDFIGWAKTWQQNLRYVFFCRLCYLPGAPRSMRDKDWVEHWFSRIIAILLVPGTQVSPGLFPITAAGSSFYLPRVNTWKGAAFGLRRHRGRRGSL